MSAHINLLDPQYSRVAEYPTIICLGKSTFCFLNLMHQLFSHYEIDPAQYWTSRYPSPRSPDDHVIVPSTLLWCQVWRSLCHSVVENLFGRRYCCLFWLCHQKLNAERGCKHLATPKSRDPPCDGTQNINRYLCFRYYASTSHQLLMNYLILVCRIC